MKSLNRALPGALALLAATPAFANGLTQGQTLAVCPDGTRPSITDMRDAPGGWAFADVGYALRCKGDPNIYLVSDPGMMFIHGDPATMHVNAIVQDGTPSALFVPSRNSFGADPVMVSFPSHPGVWSATDPVGLLYTDPNHASTTCGQGKAELLLAEMQVDERTGKVSFPEPVALGACIDGPAGWTDENHAGHPRAVNVLDYDLDRDAGTLSMVVMTSENGDFPPNGVEVIRVDLATKTAKAVVSLQGDAYFPRGCGAYIKAVRLMPGAPTKLALFYATPKIEIVDFTDASHPVTSEAFNADNPEIGRTCEGYVPSYKSERETIRFNQAMEGRPRAMFWFTTDMRTFEPTVAKVVY